jgi:hypothetical protein
MDAKTLALALAVLVPPAFAGDAARTDAKPDAADPSFVRIEEHMKRMRDTMARMQETTHPDERQALVDRHERELQTGLELLHEHEQVMRERSRR